MGVINGRVDLSVELQVDGLINDTRPSDRLQDSIHDLFQIHFSFLVFHMSRR
jgi:hypothetical protein